MPHVKSLRDVRIASLEGHVINVPARKPTRIPESLIPEAQALGCVVCDEVGRIAVDADEVPTVLAEGEIPYLTVDERTDTEKRSRVLKLACAKSYARNERADFDKNNLPKVVAIQKLVGFPVTTQEIADTVESMQGTE